MTETVPDAYWSRPPDELLDRLGASAAGLTAAEVARRREAYGPNDLHPGKRATPLGLFLNQFKSPIVLILLFATFVSAFLRDWPDAVIILLIVLGSAVLSFTQEYSASAATEKLQAQVAARAAVWRDGQVQTIPAAEVVPGDVLQLSAGSLVPADSLVLSARDCFVNQATLTGETFPVEKKPGALPATASLAERSNVVFMGTNVRSGSATALVVNIGKAAVFGQIAGRLAFRSPETDFEHGVRRLGYLLTEVMLLLVLGIFAFNVSFQRPVLDSLLFSLALAVGLTPQLLPAIININLSRGAAAMARSGVIVRRLAAIEDFGSMDILCTDKTGTLTVGVVQLDGALDGAGQPAAEVWRLAYLNARLQTGLSNPLDEAILASATPPGATPSGATPPGATPPGAAGAEKLDEIPYDFVRKRLSVLARDGDEVRLITKGALNNVLAVCTGLDDAARAGIAERYAAWSDQGYRVLGVAEKAMAAGSAVTQADEADMRFVGFLLFLDPPKADAAETLTSLAELGVSLKIITGDNRLVAHHVAQTIGLPGDTVLTGADLDEVSTEALPGLVERADLFAEVDPNQKERIITALQTRGHVVGYMGDGINDAPSLHTANVGISVDGAVDVAREAADFVLLRKDLGVLRDGIAQGRATFANTLKYVFMATSANFGNMFSMAIASILLPFLPMLPKQILVINFLTDLPEIAIARDRVDEATVRRPRRWDIRFIRRFMLVFGPLSSVFDFATFAILYWGFRADEASFHTGWFLESILSATLVVFVLRTRLPFWRSRAGRSLQLLTVVAGLAAFALPYSPLAGLLGLTPLPAAMLLVLILTALVYVVAAEGTKRWFYRRVPA